MKARLGELEEIRRDPAAYKKGGSGSRVFGGLSRTRVLHLSVYDYHRTRGDLTHALGYLRDTYERNFKQMSHLARLEDQLSDYVSTYRQGGYRTFQTKVNVQVSEGNLQLTGEIPRLDLDGSGGYSVWLFGKSRYDWRNELRMPLLQRRFAERMVVSNDYITVGFYFFETSEYDIHQYSDAQIEAADAELAGLASVFDEE